MRNNVDRLPIRRRAHARMRGRQLRIGYIHEFDIEDQIGFGWNAGVVESRPGASVCAVRKLPRNEQTTLAAHLHPFESIVEAGDDTANSLQKADRLAHVYFCFTVGIDLRLSVVAHDRRLVVVG